MNKSVLQPQLDQTIHVQKKHIWRLDGHIRIRRTEILIYITESRKVKKQLALRSFGKRE